MRLIIIGPQGAGKGTQGVLLAERLGIPHVATGDLLRAATRAGTPLGVEAKGYMDRGELVPDELVLGMLRERLSQPDAQKGFLLDGFPRNDVQAKALDDLIADIDGSLTAVVSLEVPDEVLIERMSARRVCPTCGTPYTQVDGQPATCSKDGAELVQRDDDKPEAIAQRLAIFHDQTAPLIDYYTSKGLVTRVDGVGPIREVTRRMVEAVS